MFKNRLFCPLQCNQENPQIDTQEHLLTCTNIKTPNTNNLRIQNVFQELEDQEKIGKLVCKILQEKIRLIDEFETSLPGAILDQSALFQGATAVYFCTVGWTNIYIYIEDGHMDGISCVKYTRRRILFLKRSS